MQTTTQASPKSPRHRARELAVQGIYQWKLTETSYTDFEQQLSEEKNLGYYDKKLFEKLLRGALYHHEAISKRLESCLDRPASELNPVEFAVLMLGTFELLHHPEAPYKVIINECVELAKTFGSNDGHKYVNGVLDKLAPAVRPDEPRKKR